MQGSTPRHLPLAAYPPVLTFDTDTATPRSLLPIYYIHSLKSPFCRNPECACHRRQQEVKKPLGFITEGILTLQEAAHLLNEQKGEAE